VLLTNVPCNAAPKTVSAIDAVAYDPVRHHALSQFLATYARSHSNRVAFGDLDRLLCPDGVPLRTAGDRRIRDSRGSLTSDGGRYLWEWIVGQLTTRENRQLERP
jgi:hypothetical protein